MMVALLTAVSADASCRVSLNHSLPLARAHNVGFLLGFNAQTPDSAIAQLAPHVVRLSWLTSPFWSAQAARLAALGVDTLQLILGPQAIEARSPLNSSTLKAACWPQLTQQCPLPGAVADPHYAHWEAAINDTVAQVHAQGLGGRVLYDVWNEPNFVGGPGGGGGGWPYPSRWYTPPPGRPHYTAFWEVWNRAVRLLRALQPNATVVGPSAAPGPGVPAGSAQGWQPQLAWLREFLAQAAANDTLPDVLSWHDYTGVPSMAPLMQAELRSWMAAQPPPLGPARAASMPMGFNEIVDGRHAQSAGYHVALAASLARCDPPADHAALGCWAEPGPAGPAGAPSTCWDGSLDGMLAPGNNFSARPVWWALRWLAEMPENATWVQLAVSASNASGGGACMLDGVAAQLGSKGPLVVLIGRWARAANGTGGDVTVALGTSAAPRCVRIQRLAGCANLTVACNASPPSAEAPVELAPHAPGELSLRVSEAEALRLEVTTATSAAGCKLLT
jgi:hypothetical protein